MSIVNAYKLFKARTRAEFDACVEPLLRDRQVRALDDCKQHWDYTRLRHSVDVAYLSFVWTRLLGWDSRSTARAALLHDLFFHEEGQGPMSLMRSHPEIAVENARKVCALSPLEEDIIRKHMWLLTLSPPRYKEGFVVTFVDKFCAAREIAVCIFARRRRRGVFEPV